MVTQENNLLGNRNINFINDEVIFRLTPQDYIVEAASAPYVEITLSAIAASVGTTCKILGQTFKVGTSNQMNEFVWNSTTPSVSADNLFEAIKRNAKLGALAQKTIVTTSPYKIRITYNVLGVDSTLTNLGMSGTTQPNAIEVNTSNFGSDGVYKEDYYVRYQLFREDNFPLTQPYSTEPLIGMNGSQLAVIANFKSDVFGNIEPTYNNLNTLCLVLEHNLSIKLRYGSINDMEFTPTSYMCLLGQKLQGENAQDFNHLEVGLAKFLNTRPARVLHNEENYTLWFYIPDANSSEIQNYEVKIETFNAQNIPFNAQILTPNYSGFTNSRIMAIPIGRPQRTYNNGAVKVKVTVLKNENAVSQSVEYTFTDCGHRQAELYFINEHGVWETIRFDYITANTTNVEQKTAITIPNAYLGSRSTSNYDVSGLDKISLIAEYFGQYQKITEFYKSFLKSPYRKILHNGAIYNFILDKGEFTTFSTEEIPSLVISGYVDNQKL